MNNNTTPIAQTNWFGQSYLSLSIDNSVIKEISYGVNSLDYDEAENIFKTEKGKYNNIHFGFVDDEPSQPIHQFIHFPFHLSHLHLLDIPITKSSSSLWFSSTKFAYEMNKSNNKIGTDNLKLYKCLKNNSVNKA